jgi:uncharacterized membrane protein YkoI
MIRILAIGALVAWSMAAGAAEDETACLNEAEQKAAISQGQAVTLATAIRSVRGSVRERGSREIVRARLCREPNRLVYLLTVLARDGKVTHTAVDATSGKVVDLR